MPKLSLKEAEDWLIEKKLPFKIVEWGGKSAAVSKFYDERKNEYFNMSFFNLKTNYKKGIGINSSNEEVLNKRKKFCLEKYGVDNPLKNKKIQEKIKQTYLEKYGVNHYSQTDEYKEKVKQTSLKKWGVDNPNKAKEVREKVEKTCLEKYGHKTNLLSKENILKVKQTNIKKYGFEYPYKNEKIKEKVKNTCLKKYGVEHPSLSKVVVDKTKKTKIKNGVIKLYSGKTAREWSEDSKLASTTTIRVYANLGLDPKKILSGRSLLEVVVQNFLETIGLIDNIDFIHDKILPQHEGMKSGYRRPDFLFPELKLIIECDGEYYHDPEKDKIRNEEYKKLGYKVLSFSGNEIDKNFDYVKSKIRKKIMILKHFKGNYE